MKLRLGLAAAAAMMLAAPALAQAPALPNPADEAGAAATDAAKAGAGRAVGAAKKRAAAKNATEVVFVNNHSTALTGATVSNDAGKVIAAVKKPLGAGKRLAVKLPKNAGCVFTIQASFAGEAEFDPAQVDLCADKTVRFTE